MNGITLDKQNNERICQGISQYLFSFIYFFHNNIFMNHNWKEEKELQNKGLAAFAVASFKFYTGFNQKNS